ncbi:MAG TPA: hypothetical protein VH595_02790 [Verrucomicrobiae bacterium]|jgi:hypothetical protein|nr:hypothetical protein [Verrucomicrobiae bacterium]
MKEYFGTGAVARILNKSTVAVRQAIQRGIVEPDAMYRHENGTHEALFLPRTLDELRLDPAREREVVCQ